MMMMTRYNQCFASAVLALAFTAPIFQERGILVHSLVTPHAVNFRASGSRYTVTLGGSSLDDDTNGEQLSSSPTSATTSVDEMSKEEVTPPPPSPPETLQRQSINQRGPSPQDLMMAMGTNPRRIAISLLSASGIALAGNFLGVTSRLLTAVPEVSTKGDYITFLLAVTR